MRIYGCGFDAVDTYGVQFLGANDTVVSSNEFPVTFESFAVQVVDVSTWHYAAGTFQVLLQNLNNSVFAQGSALFTVIQGWKCIAPAIAEAPSPIFTVTGAGFVSGGTYELALSSGEDTYRTSAGLVNYSTLIFHFNESHNLIARNYSVVVLYNGSEVSSILDPSCSGTVIVVETWVKLNSTVGLASGGETLQLQAYGLNPLFRYACTFSSVNASSSWQVEATLTDRLLCITPAWGSLYAAALTANQTEWVLQVSVQSQSDDVRFRGEPGDRAFVFVQMWSSSSVYPCVHAFDNSNVTLRGFGFDPMIVYNCSFLSRESGLLAYGSVDYVNHTSMVCYKIGKFDQEANLTMRLELSSSDVQVQDVEPTDLYLIETFVSIYPDSAPGTGNLTITVRGFGFIGSVANVYLIVVRQQELLAQVTSRESMEFNIPPQDGLNYNVDVVVQTNFLNCPDITSNEKARFAFRYNAIVEDFTPKTVDLLNKYVLQPVLEVKGAGFEQSKTYEVQYTLSENFPNSSRPCAFSSTKLLTCEIPILDISALQWSPGYEVLAQVSIFAVDGTGRVEVPKSVSFQTADILRYVQINSPPFFQGKSVFSTGQESIQGWAINIHAGYFNGEAVAYEDSQNYTFSVYLSGTSIAESSIFTKFPTVDSNGNLQFDAAIPGAVEIDVTLQDSGGTEYGGYDKFTQTFMIVIEATKQLPLSVSSFDIVESNQEKEYVVRKFYSNLQGSSVFDFMSQVAFNINLSAPFTFALEDYFSHIPQIDSYGNLLFTVRSYVFGNVSLTVQKLILDANSNIQTQSVVVPFYINILPRNDPPYILLSNTTISGLEDQWDDLHALYEFAQKFPGPINVTTLGPQNEDWPEEHQNVSFSLLTYTENLFSEAPALFANGTLTFATLANAFGTTNISLYAFDDGGTLNGGSNTSRTYFFTIELLAVNDPPFMVFLCTSEDANYPKLTCKYCENITSYSCRLQILQNCVDCPGPRLCLERFPLPLYNLSTAAPGVPGEGNQSLWMYYNSTTTSDLQLYNLSFLIDDLNKTASVSFCVELDSTGLNAFDVFLQDSGGTANGGIDTFGPFKLEIESLPVNQQPSFSLCEAGQAASCCEANQCCSSVYSVWEGDRDISDGQVVTHVLKGNQNRDGIDNERQQLLTFSIVANVTQEDFVNGSLVLNTSKAIEDLVMNLHVQNVSDEYFFEFLLKPWTSGVALLEITAIDDGGTVNGGKNVSLTHTLTFSVLRYYIQLMMHSQADVNALAQGQLCQKLKEFFQAATEQVAYVSEVLQVIPSDVSGNDTWVFEIRNPLFANIRMVYDLLSNAQDHIEVNGVNFSNLSVSLHVRSNYTSNVMFTVRNQSVDLKQGAFFEETHFINIEFPPRDAGANSAGQQIVEFSATPLTYRPYTGADLQTADGLDPGILVASFKPVCDPMCRSADLEIRVSEFRNGFVEYNVSLGDWWQLLNLNVIPKNLRPFFEFNESYFFYEDRMEVNGFLLNVSAGHQQYDERFQNLTFSLVVTSGQDKLLDSPALIFVPDGDQLGKGYSLLNITLLHNENGLITVVVNVTDDGSNIEGEENLSYNASFSFTVVPVNDPPTFEVPNSTASALEDSGVYNETFVENISPGAENEWDQQLTFVFEYAEPYTDMFDIAPYIEIQNRTGYLIFRTGHNVNGNFFFNISLQDNGGVEHGGNNISQATGIEIE
eukprot:763789-Hanusia_phi.AAC.1